MFSCTADELFEAVKLSRPVTAQVVIEPTPFVAPMITAVERRWWLVALVDRRSARVLSGSGDGLEERARVEDAVRGKSEGGGWSQSNYERSVEADVDAHLKRVAEIVDRRWREERFDRVAIGGQQETVSRFEKLLADDVRRHLASGRVERRPLERDRPSDPRGRREARLRGARSAPSARSSNASRTRSGRVDAPPPAPRTRSMPSTSDGSETLLLEPGFDLPGKRCPNCELLLLQTADACPADGSALEEVDHLREAVVESALTQDANVLVVRSYPDLGPHRGIAAMLRF